METTRTFQHEAEDEQVERVELAVAKLLRLGTVTATVLIAVGLAVLILQLPTTLGPTLITTGLIALVCTPLLRVAAALLIYLRVGDRTYSILSLMVLVVVFTGVLLGQAH